MRRAARIDGNQTVIIRALRKIGASVQPLHMVGAGCPDLVVGFRGKNFMLEVKDGRKPESRRRLTDDEKIWQNAWRGQVAVVKNEEEAIRVVSA